MPTCTECKMDSEGWHEKGCPFYTSRDTMQKTFLYGWLCPRCGRGNSPNASVCPCLPVDDSWQIT